MEGFFVSSFHDLQQYPQLHTFLEENKTFEIRVIGVTGATPGTAQGTLIEERKSHGGRLVSSNYYYTVTRAHPLGKFLSHLEIDQVDLMV